MISFLKRMISRNPQKISLVLLLSIFIVFDIQIPVTVAQLIDSILGKIGVIAIALSLLNVHPLVGILGLVAAYVLIERSSTSTGVGPMKKYNPSEEKKAHEMTAMNHFPMTVEEEVIQNMLPVTSPDIIPPEYKPTQENLHNASKV
jgi:hypothetical protein